MTENTQTNVPAVQEKPRGGTMLAKPSDLAKAHQEEAKNLKAGRIFLKFSKGDWFIGKDADTFPNNKFYFVPAMDMFEKGWQCWKGGKPVDERFTAYGGVAIPQSELPDHGPYPGKNDGWAEAIKFPLMIVPHDGTTTAWMNVEFAASSSGGKNACYSLSKQFLEKIKLGEIGDDRPYPLVRAGVDSYVHKEWGKVPYPVFEIIGGLTEDDVRKLLASAKSTIGGDSDKADEPAEKPEKTDLDAKQTRKPAAAAAPKPAAPVAEARKPAGSGAPGWDGDKAIEAAKEAGIKYSVVRDGKSAGPFTIAELEAGAEAGWFKLDSMVWAKGMPAWAKAETVAVLAAVLTPPEPEPDEPPPPPVEDEPPPPPAEDEPPPPPAAEAKPAKTQRKKMAV